jgi:hypothetical protein
MDPGRGRTPQGPDGVQCVLHPHCSKIEAYSRGSKGPSREAEAKAAQIVPRDPFIREKFTRERSAARRLVAEYYRH